MQLINKMSPVSLVNLTMDDDAKRHGINVGFHKKQQEIRISGDCPLFAPDPGPDPDRGLDPCDMPVLCE
ncbi:hypothetical protein RUM43_013285 [Polyplax serrata]|uniref:Uncharacterized protein n=1 Tax=Polyplax serrata TaxID=468196 RepID=A0AAN8S3R8_POLSC